MGADVKVAILGAGFAGLCMGLKLQARGETDFVILEKAARVGGTWRENIYPGAGCDIPRECAARVIFCSCITASNTVNRFRSTILS